MKEDNKAYWAGVWFALGIGMVLHAEFLSDAGAGPALIGIMFVFVAALGSWLASGIAITALLLMILERL